MYINIYIYMYMCVCVHVTENKLRVYRTSNIIVKETNLYVLLYVKV